MRRRLLPWLTLAVLPLTTGCASHSHFGLVLQPDTNAALQVFGDQPIVQVDNDGPGQIDVAFTPAGGSTDSVRVVRGTAARTLRGGGTLRFVLVEGSQANVQVHVQDSTGTDLRVHGAAR
jgi:hypothetical protein